jgi:hypothetical protein
MIHLHSPLAGSLPTMKSLNTSPSQTQEHLKRR